MKTRVSTAIFATLAFAAAVSAQAVAVVKDGLQIARHRPCNLFTPDAEVAFAYSLKNMPAGEYKITAAMTDAFGAKISEEVSTLAHDGSINPKTLALRNPGRGYYELAVTVASADAAASQNISFGVMEKPGLSGAEFLAQDRRFGLKWWGGVADKEETLEMLEWLGLQWTRTAQNDTLVNTNENLAIVLKIERFPRELYDEAKYGPMAEWEAKFGRGAWTLKTIPKEAEYKAYLAEFLRAFPKSQNVFEIWNEAWDKMNAEDFSVICKMVREVVSKERPDAKLGPNLLGDMSEYGYDYKVWKAGGMDGMDIVHLHPYGTSENRAFLREYRDWISKLCGRPIEIYITEYGAHSTPEGPAKQSEVAQSQRVIRQSLALYAEDMKALIPHWAGQSENNPTYHEDWFGFIRKNQQPKPVLLALANCARLIDGGEYLGDLWFGPRIGAMAFRKDGRNVLALYASGANAVVPLAVGGELFSVVDMFGREERHVVESNEGFALRLDDNIVYITDLPDSFFANATKELRADRFPKPERPPRITRVAPRPARPIVFDGEVVEWDGAKELYMHNPKVNGDDASGSIFLAWDEDYLYVAVKMRDNELLNTRPRARLYQHDSVELFVSTEPRNANPGYGPNDYQFFLCPASGEGVPIVGWVADREKGEVLDVPGSKFAFKKIPHGWSGEVAIPWSALGGFKAGKGAKLALETRVNDADTSHERWKIDPVDVGFIRVEDPSAWSLLLLD